VNALGMIESYESIMVAIWVSSLVMYVIQAITLYFIAQKAGVRNPWVAFIPVLQTIVFLHIIDKSGWAIFLLFIPFVNIVIYIVWTVKFYVSFDVNAGLIALSIIIPIVGLVMVILIAFTNNFSYKRTNRFATA
jgi:signal peptidase I